jgi:hypothetical protein|tara:strand:+ start:439 stop:639 length:201 start_codon:yes stop_codon:yes gene_type:complete
MNQKKIDDVARLWNKTKDPKYKDLWYDYIKEYNNGINNSNRRNVSSDSSDKTDDGWNSVDKQPKLF